MSSSTLAIENLHHRYGSHDVLRGLNLNIEESSIVGLVGLNGSGKTTTIECLLGLQRFGNGTVEVLGKDPSRVFELNGRVAAVFDQPCLYPGLTVRQSFSHTNLVLRDRNIRSAATEDSPWWKQYRNFKTKKLSFGNKRRLAILQALLGSPEFIVFDEPFIGLDAASVEDVLQIVEQTNKDHGTTFLLASHQLPYLERICTHIAILHDGTIVLYDKLDNLFASRSVTVQVRSQESARIEELALSNPNIELTMRHSDDYIELSLNDMSSAELNSLLVRNDVSVSELLVVRQSLNALFRSITDRGDTEEREHER